MVALTVTSAGVEYIPCVHYAMSQYQLILHVGACLLYLLNCFCMVIGFTIICIDPGAFGFGATCQFNQKERNLLPCLLLPYYEPEQLVPTRPPPINHPWILPFPQDSIIDHNHYQQIRLFTSENVSN